MRQEKSRENSREKCNKSAEKNAKKTAFSLIEMSIVLLIIAIISSAMLTLSTSSLTNEKTALTKERIDQIYKSLGEFVLKNHRLPCPASLMLTKKNSGYGTESGSAGSCAASGVYASNLSPKIFYGAVPVNSLGLADEYAQDGFGSKFAYIVYEEYTAAGYPNINLATFSYTIPNSMLMPATLALPAGVFKSSIAFAIISFGPNKYGAFNANSTSQNSYASATTSEEKNILTNIATSPTFTADFGVTERNAGVVTISASDITSSNFDDVVFAKTHDEIITDFNAMFLVPCILVGSGFVQSFYGKIQYRGTTCNFPNQSIIPSIECTAFGNVVTKQSCP